MATGFTVNGRPASTDAPPATPLLWVIREGLKLTGTKFGCGTGLCGACMVHIDGKRAFSCQTQVSEVAGIDPDSKQLIITDIYNYRDGKILHPTGYLPSFVESLILKKLLELKFLYGSDGAVALGNGLKASVRPERPK